VRIGIEVGVEKDHSASAVFRADPGTNRTVFEIDDLCLRSRKGSDRCYKKREADCAHDDSHCAATMPTYSVTLGEPGPLALITTLPADGRLSCPAATRPIPGLIAPFRVFRVVFPLMTVSVKSD
jgi:hypothetical protein